MNDVFSLLRQKEEQLQLLARQVEALRVAAQLIRAEEKLLGKKAEPETPSQPEMIRTVLAEHRKPMHVRQISAAIKKKFRVKLKPLYLTSIIYRLMKAGRYFRKEGPNTFGLSEWPQQGHLEPVPAKSFDIRQVAS
jgi:HB1, ASXL, restriction endonuclease HTH domain